MNRTIYFAVLLWLLGASFNAQGASFDCTKATERTEKAICSDPELSKLDEQLSRAYKRAVAAAISKASVQAWQRYWLYDTRESCWNAACLKEAYSSQIRELNEHAEVVLAGSAISGQYVRYYRGKPDTNDATINVLELKNARVRIVGFAVWIGNRDTGNVNTGEINGLSRIVENKVHYISPVDNECSLVITFTKNALMVDDKSRISCYGFNVTFSGEYRKIDRAK